MASRRKKSKKSSKKVKGRHAKYYVSWTIQNFNMCPQKFGMMICSPPFVVGLLGGTKWSLIFYPRGVDTSPDRDDKPLSATADPGDKSRFPSPNRDYMAFYLQREEHSNKIDSVLVDFDLKFEIEKGRGVKRIKSFQNKHFKELDRHGEAKFFKIKQRSLGNMDIYEEDIQGEAERRRRKPPKPRRQKPKVVKEDVFSRTRIELKCELIFKECKKITSENNIRDIDLLSSDLIHLYDTKYLVDLEIACGNQVFSVHRALLFARCPKLLKCLAFENCEGIPRRAWLFCTPNKVFRCLLIYIYTGRLAAALYNIRSKLYEVAYFLEMEDLIQLLDNFPDSSKFTTTFQTEQYKVILETDWLNLKKLESITRVLPSSIKCFQRLVMICEVSVLKVEELRWRTKEESNLAKKKFIPKRYTFSLSFCFYITGLEKYENLVLRCKIGLKKSFGQNPFKVLDRRYSFKSDGSWRGNGKVSTQLYVDQELPATDSEASPQKTAMECDLFLSDVAYYSEAVNTIKDIFRPCKLIYNRVDANADSGERDELGRDTEKDLLSIWGDSESNDNAAPEYMPSTEDEAATSYSDPAAAASDEDAAGVTGDMPLDNFKQDCDVDAEETDVDKEADFTTAGQSDEEAAATGVGVDDEEEAAATVVGVDDEKAAATGVGVDDEEEAAATGVGVDDEEEAAATGVGVDDEEEAAVTIVGKGGNESASTAAREGGEAISGADAKDIVSSQKGTWRKNTLRESIRKCYKYSPLQLSSSLLALMDSEAYSDFTLLSEGGQKFNVHKAILGIRSSSFRCKFHEDSANYSRDESEDLSPTTTKLLLSYLYSGVVGDMSDDERVKLRKAAQKYDISCLSNKCDSFS